MARRYWLHNAAAGRHSSRQSTGSRSPNMPDWSGEIEKRLSSLDLDSTHEIEVVEELSQHLDDRYQELISSGATDADARRDVLMELHHEQVPAGRQLKVMRQKRRERTLSGSTN